MEGSALLVGGGRFVGRRLLAVLLSDGYRLDVLNRGWSLPPEELPPAVRHLAADRTDPAAVRRALGGREYDVVFDTSGYRPQEVRSVLDAVDAGRYVYISTCMVYSALSPVAAEPDVPEVGPLDENDDTVAPRDDSDGDMVAAYPEYKRGCELALLGQERIPATVLRPCGIYGAGDYCYRHDYFFDRVVRGRPVLVPDSHAARTVHLTSVDGLVEVCRLAAAAPSRRHLVLNVVDASALTCTALAELCAQVVGVPPEVVTYPAALATRLGAALPERARFPFGPEPGFTLSGTRAARELGWPGTAVKERTATLLTDFIARYRAGRVADPDFSLDDAILAGLPHGWMR
jgi:2'-hydroxyisoflavone reductase